MALLLVQDEQRLSLPRFELHQLGVADTDRPFRPPKPSVCRAHVASSAFAEANSRAPRGESPFRAGESIFRSIQRSAADAKRRKPSAEDRRMPRGLGHDAYLRQSGGQRVERDLGFEARERRAEAVVNADAEGQVLVDVSGEIEPIR